jgi:hypothetical protein
MVKHPESRAQPSPYKMMPESPGLTPKPNQQNNTALCFEGIGFLDVGVAVFTGRLGWLADRIVPCGPRQAARSREEWVALLQRRLRPVVR